MALLDTSVLLDLAGKGGKRREERAKNALRQFGAGQKLATTRICVAELRVGVHKSSNKVIEAARIDLILKTLEVVELTPVAAEIFAMQKARLQRLGTPLDNLDLLIAAIALDYGEPFITSNPRHFSKIIGLQVLSY